MNYSVDLNFMHSIIFYSSYLAFPFLIFLLFLIYKKGDEIFGKKILLVTVLLLLLITIVFIYSRFIERNIILIKTSEIEVGFSGKIVVIADLHLGVYKGPRFLERVVRRINKIENADAVLIPGDFTYYPPEKMEDLFRPLRNIEIPVYAVLGNHDSERPGPPIQKKLQEVLENNGVIFLNNKSHILENKKIRILGLGDNWADEDDVSKINNFSENDNIIVITHNPDTTLNYEDSLADITISGHTHGSQIRIPFLYKEIIPYEGDFDEGLYESDYGKIFVSAGIGEMGLPMRLGVPPRIDILELK